VIEEDARAFALQPLGGDESGMSRLEQPRNRTGELVGLLEGRPPLDRRKDVNPVRAARLHVARELQLVEQALAHQRLREAGAVHESKHRREDRPSQPRDGNDRPGRDDDRLAGAERARLGLTGSGVPDHGEVTGRVRRPDRVAVHRRAVEGRQVCHGDRQLSNDTAGGARDGDIFGPQRPGSREHEGEGFVDGRQGAHNGSR